ncbi:hypothetical protein [Streptomyces inhibens]|uniref:hypothetical protein n=1 Tax=Streptomyces inhibens TaxID=2293571 RepID=UPI001EE6F073|nr:hypothetical protein [Streptomyces inhibens]UKY49227.1 hypothetical protein KI385_10755 [Streptomyces inhibens]
MLNPIDTAAVIRNGGAVGRYPGQIHQGVAWWIGACLVVTQKARQLVVAHNGHPAIADFAHRLCRGATNAQHYSCAVHYMGGQSEEQFLTGLAELPDAPGGWLTASDAEGAIDVCLRLHTRQGVVLDDTNGLAEIRKLIAEDHVPIPVNDQARGSIELWRHPLTPGDQP